MSLTVVCGSCRQQVLIADAVGKARCPTCGTLCDVRVSAGPLPPVSPLDEDDSELYALPPDERKIPCPRCKYSLPSEAVVCANCGLNLDTGETLERLYPIVDKQWETGFPYSVRIGVFLTLGGLALTLTLVVGLVDGGWLTLLLSLLCGIAITAYALGTFPRIRLVRNRRGKVRLTRTWHICFIPLNPAEIRWRKYEAISVGASHAGDFWDWIILVVLLPFGLIPAVIWWICMIQPGQFETALCTGHGFPEQILYHGPSQATADELAAVLHEATGLPNASA